MEKVIAEFLDGEHLILDEELYRIASAKCIGLNEYDLYISKITKRGLKPISDKKFFQILRENKAQNYELYTALHNKFVEFMI